MLLIATYTTYEVIKWWLPIVSAGGIVIKAYLTAKKSISEYAEKLLNNHLAGIEAATKSTEAETKRTNALLKDSGDHYQAVATKLDTAFETMSQHHEKQLFVWDSVSKTLAVLEDRTQVSRRERERSNFMQTSKVKIDDNQDKVSTTLQGMRTSEHDSIRSRTTGRMHEISYLQPDGLVQNPFASAAQRAI